MSFPSIGLVGRKRTGKDTAAAHLIENYEYVRHAFADPLRELACLTDPLIQSPTGRYAATLQKYGYEFAKEQFPEVRRFLQNLGTGARDVLGESVWVDALVRRVEYETAPSVVTDVRFPNEVAALKNLGYVLVKITRPSVLDPSDNHPSETLTDDVPADFVYENEGSLRDLYDFMDGLVWGNQS